MLKPNQTITIRWGNKNKDRLVALGYEFTKFGDEVTIKVEHLSCGSSAKIVYICDYCGAEVKTRYQTYKRGHEYSTKDACKHCAPLKSRDAFFVKYGVTNPLQVPEINQKQRETCIEKYGVEYALQNKDLLAKKEATCIERYGESSVLLNAEIAERKRQTCLEVYGCESPMQNEEVRAKQRKTNLERYGVEFASQAPEVKAKMRKTFMEKYGVEYSLQYPEFAKKAAVSIMNTLKEHGNIATSKAQVIIYDLCKDIYGEDNVELNRVLNSFSLDVALLYKGQLIDIEYDGTYWHTDEQKDRRRDEVVKSHGYKVIRFRGKKDPPSKEVLVDTIEEIVSTSRKFKLVNVDI